MGLKQALLCSAVIAGASFAGGGIAYAQQARPAQAPAATPSAAALEEVVVTARKREESLQTVPVAVTTQSGQQLERQRVTEPTGLTRITPSLRIALGSGSDNSAFIALRGQAAGDTLLGISQPVGLYEDNVNIPHPFGSNNSFVDISRVEVLKGPQGTLYGRNTTGGAINIITRSPDYDGIHGFIEGEVGNFSSGRVVGAVNVPIVKDILAVRLAAQYWTKDGFGKSVVTGQKFGDDHDDTLVRFSARYDPMPTLSANFKFEYGKADHTAPMLANRSIAPGQLQFLDYASAALWKDFIHNAPIVGAALTGNLAAAGQVFAIGGAILNPCIGGSIYENCSATHQFDNLETWHGGLDVNWDITDTVRLRSITGYHKFTDTKVFDLDSVQPQILEVGYAKDALHYAPTSLGGFTPPWSMVPDQESYQWSQEFNLTGKFLERVSWLLGAYGSWDKGHGAQLAGALSEVTGLGGAPLSFLHYGVHNTSNTWALFTQEDFKITDRVSVTAGLRYTEERIGQDLADVTYNFKTNTFTCAGLTPAGAITTAPPPVASDPTSCAFSPIAQGPNGVYSHRTSSGTSYLLSLNYQITPDKLIYAKTSRGFRGGAFGRAVQVPAAPETATDYELGFKGDWFDRRLRTNLAVYQTNYDNKQVSALVCNGGELPPCTTGFTTHVLNAATARIRGVELEFQAIPPIEGLTTYGTLSYTDASYTHFPGAVSGDGVPLGNADGVDLAVTPSWQGNIGVRYERPVWEGVLGGQLDFSYRGKIPLTPINNQGLVPDSLERDMNGSVGLLNGRIDFKMADLGLTVSVWGANLTDEHYGYEGISANFTGGIGHMVVESPRTYGLTIRKTFGPE